MNALKRIAFMAAMTGAVSGCNSKGELKPDLPGSTPVAPRIFYVDRVRYVQVPANLTQELPIAEGPLAQCPDVAAARKAGQKKANAQLREIRAIQGTEVKK